MSHLGLCPTRRYSIDNDTIWCKHSCQPLCQARAAPFWNRIRGRLANEPLNAYDVNDMPWNPVFHHMPGNLLAPEERSTQICVDNHIKFFRCGFKEDFVIAGFCACAVYKYINMLVVKLICYFWNPFFRSLTSETSHTYGIYFSPISSDAFMSLSLFLPNPTTVAPLWIIATAMAFPIPLPAPVITAFSLSAVHLVLHVHCLRWC